MRRASTKRSPAPQILTALASTAAFVITISSIVSSTLNKPAVTETTIIVDHAAPLALSLAVSTGKRQGLAEFSHDGGTPVLLSLPETWQLLDVRFAALQDIASDPPSLGLRRWHIPPKAVVSFGFDREPDSLIIKNPSRISLKIRLKLIDLVTGKTDESVLLSQQNDAVLW